MRYLAAAVSALLFWGGNAQAASICATLNSATPGLSAAKPNKLYLYFPAADDSTYPEFGISGLITSPARAFDVSLLTSYSGTAAPLRQAITEVVENDYCEFNVEVIAVTSPPPTTHPRRNVVAIGTDGSSTSYGLAQNVDTGDPTILDYSRVWAGTYQALAGGAGEPLNGTNSTVARWAYAIGGTAAHEGGHNYGIPHSLVLAPGEDAFTNHIMPAGSNITVAQRACCRRHFSDEDFSILAANVGLSVQTMWNWDLVNPNAQTAHGLRMTFLSLQSSLMVSNPYLGLLSPWSTPVVTASLGTQVFKGVSYHRYQITWSVPKAWNTGTTPFVAGQVAGAQEFHVGTGFQGVVPDQPDPIIITDIDLLDSVGNTLALHPRIVSFDSVLDAFDGSFALIPVNLQASPLTLSDVRVQYFARPASIDSMVARAERVTDMFGMSIRSWREPRAPVRTMTVTLQNKARIPIAQLAETRQFVRSIDARTCGSLADRLVEPDTGGCRAGLNVSLFPATSVLVNATVTEVTRRWDPRRRAYVTGPLTTRVYYQIAGRAPDLDNNQVDDFVDVATGKAMDRNRDGVIDNVQAQRASASAGCTQEDLPALILSIRPPERGDSQLHFEIAGVTAQGRLRSFRLSPLRRDREATQGGLARAQLRRDAVTSDQPAVQSEWLAGQVVLDLFEPGRRSPRLL